MNDFPLRIDESSGEGDSKYILVNKEADFIQENLFVKHLNLSDDQRYYEIVCHRGGQEVSIRQYFPDKSKAKTPESFKVSVGICLGILTNFMRRFLGETHKVEAENWIALVNTIDAQCSPKYDTTPLRVKLAISKSQDGKFYTNIASFGPFENMSVAKGESKFFISEVDKRMLSEKNNEDHTTPDPESNQAISEDIADKF